MCISGKSSIFIERIVWISLPRNVDFSTLTSFRRSIQTVAFYSASAERCIRYDRSVRPSDRLSVTRSYHAKTTPVSGGALNSPQSNPATIMRSPLKDSPMTLHCVSKTRKLWDGIAQNHKDRFW